MRGIGREDFDRALGRVDLEETSKDALLMYREYTVYYKTDHYMNEDETFSEEHTFWVGPSPRAFERKKWRWYKPLEEDENLFLEFAGLAEKERSPRTMLEWVQEHGILGCRQMYAAEADGMNVFGLGPYEKFDDFFREVDRAATVLRLYECVIGKDHEGVERLIDAESGSLARRWWEKHQKEAPDGVYRGGVLGFALDAVIEQVNATKDAFVSRELWRPEGVANPAKVRERWTFRNLLGAMYLQMYLLLAAGEKNAVRCENCGRLILLTATSKSGENPSRSRKVRSDKRFCSKKCWRQDYYQRKEKDRRKAERERSALLHRAKQLFSRSSGRD